MYRSIMVPLDGSLFGEHALPLALSLARLSAASLHLVHVHSPLTALYLEGAGFLDESLDQHARKQQEDYLSQLVPRLGQVAPAAVTSVVLEGTVANTLADHATQIKADLVVMTTHGRGAMGRFWLGSVADDLVRRLPMPLLLARPHEGPADFTAAYPIRHILLPLDGASVAEVMIDQTIELATQTGARVTLIRAVSPVMPVSYPVESLTVDVAARAIVDQIEALQAEVCKQARDYLEGIARRFHDRGIQIETAVAVDHQPAAAIIREAERRGCDLIALETHGRHGLSRLLLGSIADKVIRGARLPVLVHRPLNV
jgi:nucleotide-binding universal stress UspA family protein